MNTLILAALLFLSPGYNNSGVAGEVVAIRAATTNATATVAIKTIESITAYSNITAKVINHETAYAITYTNFDGSAAISTNVIGYVDYDYFRTTNGVLKIISGPTMFDLVTTNTIITGTAPAAYYAKTNNFATISVSGHFGGMVTNAYIMGEAFLVTGAADGDAISVLVK